MDYLIVPPLVVGQDAVYAANSPARVTVVDAGFRVIDIQPADARADVLLIFYPGGRIRPQAYEWLGHALASQGVRTLITEFPLDLAVLSPDRAQELITRYAQGRKVVLAGHSLGGVMAARYANDHREAVQGLVLMASYPAQDDNLTDASFPALSMLAERDAVASADDVRGGLVRLPQDTELVVIPGAVHSFFGRYGPQQGDGIPTVNRDQAEADMVASLTGFLDRVRAA